MGIDCKKATEIALVAIGSAVLVACNSSSSDGSSSPNDSTASDETESPSEQPLASFSEAVQITQSETEQAQQFVVVDINRDGFQDILVHEAFRDRFEEDRSYLRAYTRDDDNNFKRLFSDESWEGKLYSAFEIEESSQTGVFGSLRAGCAVGYYNTSQGGTVYEVSQFSSGSCEERKVIPADINNNGIVDVVSSSGRVLLGSQGGDFESTTDLAGMPFGSDIVTADLNDDSVLDVARFDGNDTLAVYMGVGNGTFSTATAYQAPDTGCRTSYGGRVAVADLNEDGAPDLLAADNCMVFSWLGSGEGTFGEGIKALPDALGIRNLSVGDVNGNGVSDLVVSELNSDADLNVYWGQGDGTFGNRQGVEAKTQNENWLSHFELADINDNGREDIVYSDGSHVYILFSEPE